MELDLYQATRNARSQPGAMRCYNYDNHGRIIMIDQCSGMRKTDNVE